MDLLLKDWYTENFKSDELGAYLNDKTFNDLHKALESGSDVYAVIGVGDSLVRERLFKQLADKLGVTYDYVYRLWLDTVL